MTAADSLRGALFTLTLLCTGMVGCFLWCPLGWLPMALYLRCCPGGAAAPLSVSASSRRVYRLFHLWNDTVQHAWLAMVGMLLESLFRVQIAWTLLEEKDQRTGNAAGSGGTSQNQNATQRDVAALQAFLHSPQQDGHFNILFMNHRTRIDWLLLWALLARTDLLRGLKIIIAEKYATFPIVGWAMQTFRFIFLARRWEEDQSRLANAIRYHKATGERPTLLIFPEGSDLSDSNIATSQAFAREHGLPQCRYVLNPRTTGIVAMKNLIGAASIDAVYDITLGFQDYTSGVRTSDAHLVNGKMPWRLHFLISKHTFAPADPVFSTGGAASSAAPPPQAWRMPPGDAAFAGWVQDRFARKELCLSAFYTASPPSFLPRDLAAAHPDAAIASSTSSEGTAANAPRLGGKPPRRQTSASQENAMWQCLAEVGVATAVLLPLTVWVLLPLLGLQLLVGLLGAWVPAVVLVTGAIASLAAWYTVTTRRFGSWERRMLFARFAPAAGPAAAAAAQRGTGFVASDTVNKKQA